MSQSIVSFRMDNKIKSSFKKLCEDFGMSMSTAINLFAKTVIREKRIPFAIMSTDKYNETKGMSLVNKINEDYKKNGGKELTLDEINKIIYEE